MDKDDHNFNEIEFVHLKENGFLYTPVYTGNQYRCLKCGKPFKLLQDLKFHINWCKKYNGGSIGKKCSYCNVRFNIRKYFDNHIIKCLEKHANDLEKIVTDETQPSTFSCNICKEVFEIQMDCALHVEFFHTRKNNEESVKRDEQSKG